MIVSTAITEPKAGQNPDPFALWAEVYDQQSNPLLSLEKDFLLQLLPGIRGLDVVDMGCGTGRWLEYLGSEFPRSLCGIDKSREMLMRAEAKVGRAASLYCADCTSTPLATSSTDLCLASFVLSHVPNLAEFVRELARILRPGGTAFISDVHPDTAAALGWNRAFRYCDRSIPLRTYERYISEVLVKLREHGFRVAARLEPCFQSQQREMLAKVRGPRFSNAGLENPAIYILHVQLKDTSRVCVPSSRGRTVQVSGARIALGPRTSTLAELELGENSIVSISSRAVAQSSGSRATSLDLSGYLLLPGLINSHDHLDFGLFPNLGRGSYRNATEWANDIQTHDAPAIAKHQRIPKYARCWWGAIRNLLCGVTTVCHHNPLAPELLDPNFPINVLRCYEWAHSLAFDPELNVKFFTSDPEIPFIIHGGEGIDDESAGEIYELERRRLLGERTVLVHGTALNFDSVSLLNNRGAALIWCPVSNRFLFGHTLGGEILSAIHKVMLGSDSSLTSAGDLLDDVAVARETGIPAERIHEMLYTAPARAFRLRNGQGSIRVGGVADLIAVRDTEADPAEALANLAYCQIELVIMQGRVQLARAPILERLPEELRQGLEPLEVAGESVWLRAPIAELYSVAAGALEGPVMLGKKRVQYVADH